MRKHMKSFKLTLAVAVCAVAISTAAFAAKSAPQSSSSSWEGPYAGVNVGGGFASGSVTDIDDTLGGPNDDFSDAIAQAGVNAGYNHMLTGNTLVGVEAEATYGSQRHTGDMDAGSETISSKIDWTLALLARAGV